MHDLSSVIESLIPYQFHPGVPLTARVNHFLKAHLWKAVKTFLTPRFPNLVIVNYFCTLFNNIFSHLGHYPPMPQISFDARGSLNFGLVRIEVLFGTIS